MPTYTRRVHVAAPLDEVWAFHSRVEGLTALTPDWLGLTVESVHGPDGASPQEELVAGTRLTLSVRPFGVAPRQRWVSEITDSERTKRRASFRDVMVQGPFRRWEHTHSFEAIDGGTIVEDRVDYALPVVGDALGPVGTLGFEPMFWYRHQRTRTLLE